MGGGGRAGDILQALWCLVFDCWFGLSCGEIQDSWLTWTDLVRGCGAVISPANPWEDAWNMIVRLAQSLRKRICWGAFHENKIFFYPTLFLKTNYNSVIQTFSSAIMQQILGANYRKVLIAVRACG